MNSLYSKGHVRSPESYTAPSGSFKKRVALALAALVGFVLLYLFLMVWFGYTSVNLFALASSGAENGFFKALLGAFLGFLCIFMFKSLFVFKKNKTEMDNEITKEDEPVLFDYLYQLADEIGAPRPHKVYLTPEVNAAVFYDLSIYNLIVPSKKNLIIGLGLVNALNLTEFKSILAHEFGHFAQRSMLLGRYVYLAQQIASQVVTKRDGLDTFIAGLSSIDIRIAWIGWILSILVWAMRAMTETIFGVVALAERALSKEMEFQADLVAVSITGSDPLINSLYKMGPAEEGLNSGFDELNRQLKDKKAVPDLFSLQSNYVNQVRRIQNDKTFGGLPADYSPSASYRLFESKIVNPPTMWSTHPPNIEREQNAKRNYLPGSEDSRSAWDLFRDPKATRTNMTSSILESVKVETQPLKESESLELHNTENFNWQFLDSKYLGTFFNRFSFLFFENIDQVYNPEAASITVTKQHLDNLYSDNFSDQIEQLADMEKEKYSLINALNEIVTAEKRKLTFRGESITRNEIPQIVESLKKDEHQLRSDIADRDRLIRSLYYSIAQKSNPALATYLKSVAELVHYAEHSYRDLEDSFSKYHNTFLIIIADGNISDSERTRLLIDANSLHRTLKTIFRNAQNIQLDDSMKQKMGINSYLELYEDFKLGSATNENLHKWVEVIDGWVQVALYALHKLRRVSLEHLLKCEEQLHLSVTENKEVNIELGTINVVKEYQTRQPGKEREIQRKLGLWDQIAAGEGLLGASAKFMASGLIVFGTIFAATYVSSYSVYVYNGLGIPVVVESIGQSETIEVGGHTDFRIPENGSITTTTEGGQEIESVTVSTEFGSQNYIYNIANAGVVYKLTANYGSYSEVPPEKLGNGKWIECTAEYMFEEPPSTIQTSGSGGYKDYVEAYSYENPYNLLQLLDSTDNVQEMILSHAKWDQTTNNFLIYWLQLATQYDSTLTFAYDRVKTNPNDVWTYRLLMDHTKGEEREKMLERIQQLHKKNPDSPDFHYLYYRSQESSPEQEAKFLEGLEKWPDHPWINVACGHIYNVNSEWKKAYECYKKLAKHPSIKTGFDDYRERIRNYLSADVPLPAFDTENSQVLYNRFLKKGVPDNETTTYDQAYLHLSLGKLDSIMNLSLEEDYVDRIKVLMAGSDGASSELIQEVLNFEGDQGVDQYSLFTLIGLKMRAGKSYDYLLDELKNSSGLNEKTHEPIKAVIALIKDKKFLEAESKMKEVDNFVGIADLKLVGVVAHKDAAPTEWRRAAKNLLMVVERPYLE